MAVIAVLVVVVATAPRGWWWSSPAAETDGDARAWDAAAVQCWFKQHKQGVWLKYARKFANLDGELMSGLDKEDFVRFTEFSCGIVIDNDWRETCCGCADARWSPAGAVLAPVATAGAVLVALWIIAAPRRRQVHAAASALWTTLRAGGVGEVDEGAGVTVVTLPHVLNTFLNRRRGVVGRRRSQGLPGYICHARISHALLIVCSIYYVNQDDQI